MFFALPIRDEPNPPGTPLVTYALIAVNVVLWVVVSFPLTLKGVELQDPAVQEYLHMMESHLGVPWQQLLKQTSAYDVFLFEYGYRPGAASVATLFSSMFLHGGWGHLGGNMLFLWIFGDNVEYRLGRTRFLLAYLATGVMGTLFFTLFRMDSMVPLVGASGAISGVLGAYFIWFPNNTVKVLTWVIWFINVFNVPARWVLGFYIVVSNVMPFVFGQGGGVAYGAHIGGFVAGMGVAAAFQRMRAQHTIREGGGGPSFRPASGGEAGARRGTGPTAATLVPPSNAEAFRAALAAGSWERALREYSLMSIAQRNQLQHREVFLLADWLTETSRFDTAIAVLQRFIASQPHSPVLSRAHLRAGLIHLRGLNQPTPAYQHFLSVLDLNPSYEEERVAREALEEIEQHRADHSLN